MLFDHCGHDVAGLDAFGKSAMDTAISYGAYTSERTIRNYILRARNMKTTNKQETCGSGTKTLLKDYMTYRKSQGASSPSRMAATVKRFPFLGYSAPNIVVGSDGMVYKADSVSGTRSQTVSNMASSPRRLGSASIPSAAPVADKKATRSLRCCSASASIVTGSSRTHKHVHQSPPFLPFRGVPVEELRPISVECVALDTTDPPDKNWKKANLGYLRELDDIKSCPDAPNSSLNNSTEDIPASANGIETSTDKDLKTVTWSGDQKCKEQRTLSSAESRQRLARRYTFPKGVTTRAQSAKYHRTKYHRLAQEEKALPKPR